MDWPVIYGVIAGGTVVLAAGAIAVHRWLRSRGGGTDVIGRVVVEAHGTEWARRFGATPERLRTALLTDADPVLRRRVDQEVGVVDLTFDGRSGGSSVPITMIVDYAGSGERSTTRLLLPWDAVPQGVRAELLRNGRTPVFRKWRALSDGHLGGTG